MAHALTGLWFDGRTSGAREVLLHLQPAAGGPALALQARDGESLLLGNAQVRWPERWSAQRRPRKVVVDLGARGSLEVADAAGWEQALAAAGQKESVAQRMQTFDAVWGQLTDTERTRALAIHLDSRPDHVTVAFKDP